MIRPLSSFLLVFALLSLIVHLTIMFEALALFAVAAFVVEGALAGWGKAPRLRNTRGAQLF
jgi:hypothetical protein